MTKEERRAEMATKNELLKAILIKKSNNSLFALTEKLGLKNTHPLNSKSENIAMILEANEQAMRVADGLAKITKEN